MARDQGVKTPAAKGTSPAGRMAVAKPVATVVAPVAPAAPKKKTSLPQFAREVRVEARKISWPTWKETWITSVMVFIMVVTTAIFFSVVDGALSFLMQQILRLAG